MAAVPGDEVGTVQYYDEALPASAPPDWYDELSKYTVWQVLEAEAGELLTYSADRILLGRGAGKRLGVEVVRISRVLLGHAGWSVTGDHVPPFSLLVTRE